MLIQIKKIRKNKELDRNEVHDDCIRSEEIRSVKRWHPSKKEKNDLKGTQEMSKIFMKEEGEIKILESYESFTKRLGAIPYEEDGTS